VAAALPNEPERLRLAWLPLPASPFSRAAAAASTAAAAAPSPAAATYSPSLVLARRLPPPLAPALPAPLRTGMSMLWLLAPCCRACCCHQGRLGPPGPPAPAAADAALLPFPAAPPGVSAPDVPLPPLPPTAASAALSKLNPRVLLLL
jgi:hypothetical protein